MPSSSDSEPASPISGQNPDDWSRMIVESAPNGIIVAEKSGGIVLTNEKAQALFGYTANEFVDLKIEDLVPKRIRNAHTIYRSEYLKAPEVRAMGAGRDLRAVRKDGTEFPVEIGLTPLSVPGRELVLSSIVDITMRKEAEQKLHDYADTLEFQAEILNSIHDAVLYLDGEGIIREWNEGASRVFGFKGSEIIGHPITRIHIEDSQSCIEKIEAVIARGEFAEEFVHCRDVAGKDVFIMAIVSKMERRGTSGYLVCAKDITLKRELEAELLKVVDEQQRKIGQEIHDDLCSQLSGIGCLTKVLQDQLRKNCPKEAEITKTISEMVATAGSTARQIAHGLVPNKLENQGLGDALGDLANSNRKSFGIDIRLFIPDREAVNAIKAEIGIRIYRIAQEAISNATRHSDAESILVKAVVERDRLELTIEDDGKGMSEDLVSFGLGLKTMRRRARLIQADFDIQASPGEGTSIHCSVPLPSK